MTEGKPGVHPVLMEDPATGRMSVARATRADLDAIAAAPDALT